MSCAARDIFCSVRLYRNRQKMSFSYKEMWMGMNNDADLETKKGERAFSFCSRNEEAVVTRASASLTVWYLFQINASFHISSCYRATFSDDSLTSKVIYSCLSRRLSKSRTLRQPAEFLYPTIHCCLRAWNYWTTVSYTIGTGNRSSNERSVSGRWLCEVLPTAFSSTIPSCQSARANNGIIICIIIILIIIMWCG